MQRKTKKSTIKTIRTSAALYLFATKFESIIISRVYTFSAKKRISFFPEDNFNIKSLTLNFNHAACAAAIPKNFSSLRQKPDARFRKFIAAPWQLARESSSSSTYTNSPAPHDYFYQRYSPRDTRDRYSLVM